MRMGSLVGLVLVLSCTAHAFLVTGAEATDILAKLPGADSDIVSGIFSITALHAQRTCDRAIIISECKSVKTVSAQLKSVVCTSSETADLCSDIDSIAVASDEMSAYADDGVTCQRLFDQSLPVLDQSYGTAEEEWKRWKEYLDPEPVSLWKQMGAHLKSIHSAFGLGRGKVPSYFSAEN